MIEARIASIGLLGPGLADWPAARRILAGTEAYVPAEVSPPVPEGLSPRGWAQSGRDPDRLILVAGRDRRPMSPAGGARGRLSPPGPPRGVKTKTRPPDKRAS